ncbi:hypothetical protein EV426DRAFT_698851 [Tirmania nivea]|nr:hypothetical protein EV426DRAFT_698851 [Tirmania nivea]
MSPICRCIVIGMCEIVDIDSMQEHEQSGGKKPNDQGQDEVRDDKDDPRRSGGKKNENDQGTVANGGTPTGTKTGQDQVKDNEEVKISEEFVKGIKAAKERLREKQEKIRQ